MRRTQESVNVLLISLSEIVPVSKIDVYKEVMNLIQELSSDADASKKEVAALQKNLEDQKTGAKKPGKKAGAKKPEGE